MVKLNDFQGFKTLFKDGYFEEQRFGQAFCNHFNITDADLFNELYPDKAEKLIVFNYIEFN